VGVGWARWLGVPELAFFGVMGGLVARGQDHRDVVPLLKPGATFADERRAREAAGQGWAALTDADLYPDALPCLRAVRAAGWQVVVGGNQPAAFQRLVEQLHLPVDVVTSSGELGAAKPDAEFFRRLAARAGVAPEQCLHVGDRVDNDVVAAAAAGMAPVHLRRGPWGVLHADDPVLRELAVLQLRGLDALPAHLASLRGR
jgi:HAD superfamily hydrolase (TIGR01509 family)